MFNQYIGQYLLNKNKITADQLVEVMNYARSVRVKLGVLAINVGFMTAEQVEKVHQLQRVKDQRFGELAVDQGFLTNAQLESLLENQNCIEMGLSQALVDKKYLTFAQLEEILASYKVNHEGSKEQVQDIDTMGVDQAGKLVLDFAAAGEQGKIYQEYIALLQRNIMRFLDSDSLLGRNEPVGEVVHQWLVHQNIEGETNLFTGLAMDDATLLVIARKYSGEILPEIDELAKDSVAEFLNMVNGIFCVNASNQGMELDLQLQKIVHNQISPLKKGYSIPVTLSFGKIQVLLGLG
jgi:CheY-specific phosphatase CheX